MHSHPPGSDGEHLLQKKYGTEARALKFYNNQVLDHLNENMIDYLKRQTLLFISTADRHGNCDCSLRAGPAGFTQVIDSKNLMYPEYRGNGVLASLGNITENPHIGMFFADFMHTTIGLHINGEARIVECGDLPPSVSSSQNEESPQAERWVHIEVEEAYIHCSKHIPKLELKDKKIDWGTDDEKAKGGDFFGVGVQR